MKDRSIASVELGSVVRFSRECTAHTFQCYMDFEHESSSRIYRNIGCDCELAVERFILLSALNTYMKSLECYLVLSNAQLLVVYCYDGETCSVL